MKHTKDTSRSSGKSTAPRPSSTTAASRPDPCKQPAVCPPVFFPAVVVPQGDGAYLVKAGRPIVGEHWVDTNAAMKIVGVVSRGAMHELRNQPGLCEMIRWKYTTPRKGKVAYEVNSLWAYRKALEEVGK